MARQQVPGALTNDERIHFCGVDNTAKVEDLT
jgi:hypothetical protein